MCGFFVFRILRFLNFFLFFLLRTDPGKDRSVVLFFA